MADETVGLRLTVDGEEQYITAAANVDALDDKLRNLATATTRVDTAMVAASRGFNVSGMAVMQTAQFVDDLQYGMRGVVNNIPLLLTSLGLGAGLAGALSIVAVGINQVINHWDDLSSLWASGATETEAERMKRLAKATDDAGKAEYALLKAQQERRKAVAGMVAPFELDPAKTFAEQFQGQGGPESQSQVFEALKRRQGPMSILNNPDANLLDPDKSLRKAAEASLKQQAADLVFAVTKGTPSQQARAGEYLSGLMAPQLETLAGSPAPGRETDTKAPPDAFRSLRGEIDSLTNAAGAASTPSELDDVQRRFDAFAEQWGNLFGEIRPELDAFGLALADAQQKIGKMADAAEKEARARRRKIDQDEATQAGERMSGRAAQLYGQAYGGNLVGAMSRAARNGESDEDVDARLQTQLEARMGNLPPSLRSQAARQIIEQARMMQQDMAIQQAAGGDIQRGMIEAGMAGPNTALGRMQRQMMARQQQFGGQFAERAGRMADGAGNDPMAKQLGAADKQLQAAEAFKRAVDDFRNGGFTL